MHEMILGLIIMPCCVKRILSIYISIQIQFNTILRWVYVIYTTFNIATNNVKNYEALFLL